MTRLARGSSVSAPALTQEYVTPLIILGPRRYGCPRVTASATVGIHGHRADPRLLRPLPLALRLRLGGGGRPAGRGGAGSLASHRPAPVRERTRGAGAGLRARPAASPDAAHAAARRSGSGLGADQLGGGARLDCGAHARAGRARGAGGGGLHGHHPGGDRDLGRLPVDQPPDPLLRQPQHGLGGGGVRVASRLRHRVHLRRRHRHARLRAHRLPPAVGPQSVGHLPGPGHRGGRNHHAPARPRAPTSGSGYGPAPTARSRWASPW
jgi:hypothetical protein